MSPSKCPSDLALGRYATGELPEAEALVVDTHVGRCTACLGRLDDLAGRPDTLVVALRRTPADAPSNPPLLERAVAAVLADEPHSPDQCGSGVPMGSVL